MRINMLNINAVIYLFFIKYYQFEIFGYQYERGKTFLSRATVKISSA